jgi:hypothetical protein
MDGIKGRRNEGICPKAAGLDLLIFFLLTGKYHLVYKIKV